MKRLGGDGLILRRENSAQESPIPGVSSLWPVDGGAGEKAVGVAVIVGSGLCRRKRRRAWRRKVVFSVKVVGLRLIRNRLVGEGGRGLGLLRRVMKMDNDGEGSSFVVIVDVVVLVVEIEGVLYFTFCMLWEWKVSGGHDGRY